LPEPKEAMAHAVLKTKEEIHTMREGGKRLFYILQCLKELVVHGERSGAVLDEKAKELAKKYDGAPSFKGYKGYPANLCVSVNDEVVHGVPHDKVINEGDLLKLDFGFWYNGLCTDSAVTLPAGRCLKRDMKLIAVTEKALYAGINKAWERNQMGDIGYAIQSYVEGEGFSVVRELVGHGVGRDIHEPPQIPNYGSKKQGIALKKGMTLALEPMVNSGGSKVFFEEDGWTVKTVDGGHSAHFEHTIAITEGGPIILTKE